MVNIMPILEIVTETELTSQYFDSQSNMETFLELDYCNKYFLYNNGPHCHVLGQTIQSFENFENILTRKVPGEFLWWENVKCVQWEVWVVAQVHTTQSPSAPYFMSLLTGDIPLNRNKDISVW